MPQPGNPRSLTARIGRLDARKYRAQWQHDLRTGRIPGYVDPARCALNSVIMAPPEPGEMRRRTTEAANRRERKRAIRSDAPVATAGLLGFGREAQGWVTALPVEEQDEMYLAVAKAAAAHLGTELVGLVVHRDESGPHAHMMLVPYDTEGQLLSKRVKPAVLSELQGIVAAAAQPWLPQIERGMKRADRLARGDAYHETIHHSVRELHEALPREIEAKRAELRSVEEEAVAKAGDLEQARQLEAQFRTAAEDAREKAAAAERQTRAAEDARRRAEADLEQVRQLEVQSRAAAAIAQEKAAAAEQMASTAEDACRRAEAELAQVRQLEAQTLAAAEGAQDKAAAAEKMASTAEEACSRAIAELHDARREEAQALAAMTAAREKAAAAERAARAAEDAGRRAAANLLQARQLEAQSRQTANDIVARAQAKELAAERAARAAEHEHRQAVAAHAEADAARAEVVSLRDRLMDALQAVPSVVYYYLGGPEPLGVGQALVGKMPKAMRSAIKRYRGDLKAGWGPINAIMKFMGRGEAYDAMEKAVAPRRPEPEKEPGPDP